VARFEVTRAQYAAFDPKQSVAPGAGNLPAAGATFEQAKAYAEWLASLTGERWRLPSAEEAKTLYGGDRAGENTLDRAGYEPNRRGGSAGGAAPSG
jgi:formylglycine-generating enzyme required for sulfatase activity